MIKISGKTIRMTKGDTLEHGVIEKKVYSRPVEELETAPEE